MLWTPQKSIKQISNMGLVGALPGTAIVANATTLLDGTIVECISAANNTQDSWGIAISISADATAAGIATESAVDILIGGATDDVLISALLCGGGFRGPTINYFFPLHIPQGKRIAARVASVVVSKAFHIVIQLYGGSPPPWRCGRKVTTIGTQINNVRGQTVTPSASGATNLVTELVASSAEDYFAFMPGYQVSTDITMTTLWYNIGIGVGASTEERIGTWLYAATSSEEMIGPWPDFPVFRDVPAGTRLTMLAGCSGVIDAAYDGLIYAVS